MDKLTIALAICVVITGIMIVLVCLLNYTQSRQSCILEDTQSQINDFLIKQNEDLRKAYDSVKEENKERDYNIYYGCLRSQK